MRPIILTMQAFGPYAGRQTVDFRRALDCGLFGIYGATGAGKSSIFNAMTFALFGQAANGEQHPTTLRSDHSAADLLTEVELIFELGARCYRVRRRPEQLRPAKRGERETKELHKAWLFDVTGLTIDAISDANPGRPLAEVRVGLVDTAIVELLGYGADQFRQMVLLPQGRFETFLAADTAERVDILRKLFDVGLYRRLAEHFKNRAKDVRDDITNRRQVFMARLKRDGFDTIEHLAEGVTSAQALCDDLAEAKHRTDAELQQANISYQAAAKTDAAFAEHADAERKFQALMAQSEDHERRVERLRFARLAQILAPKAANVERAERDRANAQRACDEAKQKVEHTQTQRNAALEDLESLKAQTHAIDKERLRLTELLRFKTILDGANHLRQRVEDAARQAEKAQRDFAKVEASYEHARRHAQDVVAARDAARMKESQRSQLRLQEREAQALLRAVQDFELAQEALGAARRMLATARQEQEQAARRLEEARARFITTETALLASHALHLAAHLEPSRPCPVCGSPDHPNPASGAPGDAELIRRYQVEKAELEHAQGLATQAAHAVAKAEAALQQREQAAAALVAPGIGLADAVRQIEAITQDLAALGTQPDFEDLDRQVAAAANRLAELEAAREKAREDRDRARLEAHDAKTRLDAVLADIPEPLRSSEPLRAEISRLQDDISAHERAYDEAVGLKEASEAELASARTALEIAEQALANSAEIAADQSQKLSAELQELGLTHETFEAAKCEIPMIQSIEAQIRDFGEQRAAAQDRVKRAEAAIAQTSRPDIAALKAIRDRAETERNTILERGARAAERLQRLTSLQRELKQEFDDLDRLERDSGPLRDLALLLNGDNSVKIDLETFAIAQMFEEVLAAANLRLGPMTRGRFRLMREIEGRGNASRGLAIVVEDSYTGRPRPTSSLSGGERFMAALALALGLSDVVESTQGGIRLDAIFIDEGFGSLDSENEAGTLDQVLQTLVDMAGKGRAIGLISHVPLVQQSVPNGFWVTSTASGSWIEERIAV